MQREKRNLKGSWTYLKRTYQYAKDSKKYLIYFIIGCIFYAFISIVAPILSAKQIVALTNETWEQLFLITIAILGIEIFRNFVQWINDRSIDKYFYVARKNIKLALARETLKIDTKTLMENSSGTFIERISHDADILAEIFFQIIDYTGALLTQLGILCSIFFLNKIIFFVYLVFLVLLFITQKYAMNRIHNKRKIVKKKREQVSGFISEMVRGTKDIKILNSEESFLKKANFIIDDLGVSNYDADRLHAHFRLMSGSIRDFLDFSIISFGIAFILKGNLDIGTMLIIFSYRGNILGISNTLERFLENLSKFNLSAQKVFDILDDSVFPKEQFGTEHLSKMHGHIEFKKVSFAYDKDPILKNISFEIQPNETVSFVGKSGSGKTTIFNLIASLYPPTKGNIFLDGVPITKLDKDSIRGNLSIISQNPYIFNLSIRENFTIIKEDVTDDEIVQACKLACLHDFILTLPDGYDTKVGESGVTLSGGQRQRLAIARALIQKTEIILFDEATSALDNETQAEIQKSIQNMQGEYTILIIAHRLSTVINSDRIILIDDGKIVGTGSHQELLNSNQLYQHLYEYELKNEEKK